MGLRKRYKKEIGEGNGMEWNGMEWNGMEWNGMEWNGMEWNGMEWNGIPYSRRCTCQKDQLHHQPCKIPFSMPLMSVRVLLVLHHHLFLFRLHSITINQSKINKNKKLCIFRATIGE
jgi:hypothetical protein